MDAISLLALLGMLLTGLALKTIEHTLYARNMKAANRAVDEFARNRNVILPPELTQEDFDWFCWSMEMAGLDKKRVVNTCSCGYAEECYMHCNHELNDGKCTGHAYRPMKVSAAKQTPDLISWGGKRSYGEIVETEHRQRSVSDQKIADFKVKMIANRNAKLKTEFEASKKTVVKMPKPQYLTSPTTYDPISDCYTVYGKKISRHMLEDLIYNGGLTRDQLREIIAPDYGTLEEVHVFGRREPIAYIETPPDVSWIKTERVSR